MDYTNLRTPICWSLDLPLPSLLLRAYNLCSAGLSTTADYSRDPRSQPQPPAAPRAPEPLASLHRLLRALGTLPETKTAA